MINKKEREDLKILFDNDAGCYDNYRWKASYAARSDFKNTKESLLSFLECQKSDTILEVGCGEGTWTELIAPLCMKYDAMDISSEMLKIAKNRKGCEKVDFFQTTFESFETNEQYDKIFMVRVFEYMKEKNKMLEKMYRLLKPGGKIVIITKTFPSIWWGRVSLIKFARKLKPKNIFHIRDIKKDEISAPRLWHKRVNFIMIKGILTKIGYVSVIRLIVDIRPLIFKGGPNEYPFIPIKHQTRVSTLCYSLSKRILFLPPIFQLLIFPFSEMCIISASKGAKR